MTSSASRHTITFILPCAGEGRRLGYVGHKELFPILPDVRLIDFSLAHIREALCRTSAQDDWTIRVAVVIQPWKTEVSDYVRQVLPGVPVETVFFDTALQEWPGSVHSARNLYGDINIVLLPDSRLSLSPNEMTRDFNGRSLVERVMASLQNHDVVFGYVPCSDPAVFQHLGALHVTHIDADSGIVDRFQDKPDGDYASYNGYWCCYAFRAAAGDPLYRFLHRSVMHKMADIVAESFHPASAFPVCGYLDLGTREAVELFRSQ